MHVQSWFLRLASRDGQDFCRFVSIGENATLRSPILLSPRHWTRRKLCLRRSKSADGREAGHSVTPPLARQAACTAPLASKKFTSFVGQVFTESPILSRNYRGGPSCGNSRANFLIDSSRIKTCIIHTCKEYPGAQLRSARWCSSRPAQ